MFNYFVDGLSRLNLPLTEITVQKEIEFLEELLRWNQQINLTSITNYNEAIEKHLLDSLVLLSYLDGAKKIMDMGSGGGLPGIPLAIAVPSLKVVSVDSIGKKINFQKHIKRILQLKNLMVLQSRIEDLQPTDLEQEKYDLVLSRAFSSLETSIEYAAPWLVSGGRLIAMKGSEGRAEVDSLGQIYKEHNMMEPSVFSYKLPFSSAERQLVILKKRPVGVLNNK
ncbi:MAG: 16S rRNA (guanine(527)-N(7))-methyltransferase RsmG [Desulfuromusa sp.]